MILARAFALSLLATGATGCSREILIEQGEAGGGPSDSTSAVSPGAQVATGATAAPASAAAVGASSGATSSGQGGGGAGGGGEGGGGGGGGPDPWPMPACDVVEGTAAVTFTRDRGDSLAPRASNLGGVAYTIGLVALDVPGALLAAVDGRLVRSDDAGCTWSTVADLPSDYVELIAAPGGRAYGFQPNARVVFAYDGEQVAEVHTPGVEQTPLGLIADPLDGSHVRAGLSDGTLWESFDAAHTFEPIGRPAPDGCFYGYGFDPQDLDHVVCGTITTGAWVTFDGGESWIEAEGDGLYANAFRAVVSPVDPDVVWVQGYELGWHDGEPVGEDIRRVWRSTDGGVTYSSVIDERTPATGDGTSPHLVNGNLLAAHPTDPDVLHYTFGIPPLQGPNEASLFRFDASLGELRVETIAGGDIDDYGAITFHPNDPTLIYLALSSERPARP